MVHNSGNIWRPLGIAGTLVFLSLCAGITVGLYVGLAPGGDHSNLDPPNPSEPPPPSESPLGVYNDAAIASNCAPCAVVGRDVLIEGGTAVDAAIAVLFCEGVSCLQSMGLGGGFLMTIYNRTTGELITLNARESAPAAAYEDMYDGDPNLAQRGGLAVAVPGELKGYWEAHKRFGKLPWPRLIEPTIKVCQEGSIVTAYLEGRLKDKEASILASETLREILVNPATGHVYKEGDRIKRLTLAKTLKVIAKEGGDALYTGSLAQQFADDIKAMGGIITVEDLQNYQVRWEEPVVAKLSGNLSVYSVPAPGSGHLVTFILNILDGIIPAQDETTTYHRITESFKWAFGLRTRLGDPNYVDITPLLANLTSKDYALYIRDQINDSRTWSEPEHYGARTAGVENGGTAHVSVLAPDGSAVAVTSTINLILGAMIRSKNLGIILNDEMDDFSAPNITNAFGVPPSPENFIVPGKRPLSSMCPTIVVDGKGDVRLVVGSSGGTKITTSVPWVIIRHLWFNETIKEAIDAPRIHHQIYPMEVEYEFGTVESVVQGLHSIGHNSSRFDVGGSSVTGIVKGKDYITANADFRRQAKIAGF